MTTTPDEGARARRWRETLMGMTRKQLAEATGYSERSIVDYEAGTAAPRDMLTYRLACAAIAADLRFDWQEARGQVTVDATIGTRILG